MAEKTLSPKDFNLGDTALTAILENARREPGNDYGALLVRAQAVVQIYREIYAHHHDLEMALKDLGTVLLSEATKMNKALEAQAKEIALLMQFPSTGMDKKMLEVQAEKHLQIMDQQRILKEVVGDLHQMADALRSPTAMEIDSVKAGPQGKPATPAAKV